MRLVKRLLSSSIYMAIIALMIFAMAANFLTIAQALFSPLSVVKGGSMSPSIKQDDAVILSGVDPDGLSIGDVVVFNDPEVTGQNIIHRIVAFEEKAGSLFAMTKGDANPVTDPYLIPIRKIHSRVSIVLPHMGLFLEYLRTPAGFIICVMTPFALLLLYLIAQWYLEKTGPEKGVFAKEIILVR